MSKKPQGWIRRLVGYMKPHKKNAYVAFGVAIGGQLIQSLLPAVQKVVVDDVITTHQRPLAPWLALMIAMGVFTFVFAYFRRFRGGRIALDVQHDLRTAIFRQVNKDQPRVHHDALEFPDGQTVLLTDLLEGQEATVLQLPAQPATAAEVKAQERVAYIG